MRILTDSIYKIPFNRYEIQIHYPIIKMENRTHLNVRFTDFGVFASTVVRFESYGDGFRFGIVVLGFGLTFSKKETIK